MNWWNYYADYSAQELSDEIADIEIELGEFETYEQHDELNERYYVCIALEAEREYSDYLIEDDGA